MTYPRGAIKGTAKYVEALLIRGKVRTIYYVSIDRKKPEFGDRIVPLPLSAEYFDGTRFNWNNKEALTVSTSWCPTSDSKRDVSFMFVNYWHAHAYLMKLRQSNEE